MTPKSAKKRKQLTKIATAGDSDEEWDGNNSSDSDHEANDDSEDDDDAMDVDSDHSEPETKKKKKAAKKPPASAAKKPPTAVAASASSASKTPQQAAKTSTAANSTSGFKFSWVTPDPSSATGKTMTTQEDSQRAAHTAAAVNPLPEGVIDAGRHEHDTLEFLTPENLRDANNRRPNDPNYNPRTLKVPERFLNEQSPGMKQWWIFKAQHYDTVLFFKVGKFYELYHMDADIGYRELDLIYMKGTRAHSGFPEISYGKYASILVNNGHRVARVEQTETPEMLKARNDSSSKGVKKEKVVQRELCAVMSKGTRTFCHLDDLSILGDTGDNAGASRLLCLLEQQSAHVDEGGGCEYGLACIDPVLGTISLAQFDDDNQRTRLRTFLARYPPTEVLLQHQGYSPQTMSVIKLLSMNSSVSSTAVDLLRGAEEVPLTGEDTITMLHKGRYFLNDAGTEDIPAVLASVFTAYQQSDRKEGELVLRALGGAVKALQRALIDFEVLSLGRVYGYVPPDINYSDEEEGAMDVEDVHEHHGKMLMEALRTHSSSAPSGTEDVNNMMGVSSDDHPAGHTKEEAEEARYMILDEVALTNLEILLNNHDHTEAGSLWSFFNKCRTVGGRRLLRSWLVQPLFRSTDIAYRRAAVEELLSSSLSSVADKARNILKAGVPDLERLLSRVHSNGLKRTKDNHPVRHNLPCLAFH